MIETLSAFTMEELRRLQCQSRQTLEPLAENITSRPEIQHVIRRLMSPEDTLATFSQLALNEPDLMRLVLQASVAALVNFHVVESDNLEIRRSQETELESILRIHTEVCT